MWIFLQLVSLARLLVHTHPIYVATDSVGCTGIGCIMDLEMPLTPWVLLVVSLLLVMVSAAHISSHYRAQVIESSDMPRDSSRPCGRPRRPSVRACQWCPPSWVSAPLHPHHCLSQVVDALLCIWSFIACVHLCSIQWYATPQVEQSSSLVGISSLEASVISLCSLFVYATFYPLPHTLRSPSNARKTPLNLWNFICTLFDVSNPIPNRSVVLIIMIATPSYTSRGCAVSFYLHDL
jgi:hypothetical protein